MMIAGSPTDTIEIDGAGPVTTGALLAQLPIPEYRYWIDFLGVIEITKANRDLVMGLSGFFLGRRILGVAYDLNDERSYLRSIEGLGPNATERNRTIDESLMSTPIPDELRDDMGRPTAFFDDMSRPMFDPMTIVDYDDFWRIIESTSDLHARREVVNWLLPFGGNTLNHLQNPREETINGDRFALIGGPGIGFRKGQIDTGSRDRLNAALSSDLYDLWDFIHKYATKRIQGMGVSRLEAIKLAKGIKIVGWLNFAVEVIELIYNVYNAMRIPDRDRLAIELCERNGIKLEGNNIDFFFNFWTLRYFMEMHAQYFFNRQIRIGSPIGATWITTNGGHDITNMSMFFHNVTPHSVDMSLQNGTGNISDYMRFFEANLKQVFSVTKLSQIHGMNEQRWLHRFRAYLDDYEFRISRLDEEIKLLFGGLA